MFRPLTLALFALLVGSSSGLRRASKKGATVEVGIAKDTFENSTSSDALVEAKDKDGNEILDIFTLLFLFPNKVCCSSCKYCCNRFLPQLNDECTTRITICDVIRSKRQRCGEDCDCSKS